MPVHVAAKHKRTVGNMNFSLVLPNGSFVAVFEGDGETGYFYALDQTPSGQQIQDALPIHDVWDGSALKLFADQA